MMVSEQIYSTSLFAANHDLQALAMILRCDIFILESGERYPSLEISNEEPAEHILAYCLIASMLMMALLPQEAM